VQSRTFDVDYWEDVWEAVPIPQQKRPEEVHEIHRVLAEILRTGGQKVIEIGCAPGAWLVYFSKSLGCSVSGVELATKACEKTVENLNVQGVEAEIFHDDFFEFEHEPYDVVFSSGFIEHFEDAARVVERIVGLCALGGGLVVTMIPSMQGVNRWISRIFRPRVAAGHFPLDKRRLVELHERFGLRTRYCDYIGSLRILPPLAKNGFSRSHPTISSVLNIPFRAWNRAVSSVTRKVGHYPKVGFLKESILYVGER
jgi:SAM-dependent methyltransferase